MHFCPNCGNMLLLECVPSSSGAASASAAQMALVAKGKAGARGRGGGRAKQEGGGGAKRRKKGKEKAEESTAAYNAKQEMDFAAADTFNTAVGKGQMRMFCRTCPYFWNIQKPIKDPLPEGNGPGAYNEAAARGLDKPSGSGARPASGAQRAGPMNDVHGGEASWENASKTTGVTCDKCGHRQAYFYQVQTRSADEASTTFYRCVSCSPQWKEG